MSTKDRSKKYCNSLTAYSRRKTIEVKVGNAALGGDNPIRIQSMTTTDTMDTMATVEQSIKMIKAGCEYVRITAPSLKEANNLAEIKKELKKRGYDVPLIADIHFTPNAAEVAARIVEKVRVNPGNYVDKKKFQVLEYTAEEYEAEIERIRKRFTPLVKICKEHGTAMRIGTNHGSLSDRILSRYGDTPLGMVESALEFLRICEDLEYYEVVLSMKASNTQIMVQAYRLLVNRLEAEGMQAYPLHLGVTEAGEGEDGRIKSAVGIGALLEDGLGDTIRVSLTEDPEFEMPVAKILAERYDNRVEHAPIKPIDEVPHNPFNYFKRAAREVENIGGVNVPRVIADLSHLQNIILKDLKSIGHFYMPLLDKWKMNDLGSDFVYTKNIPIPFMLPNGLKEILDDETWKRLADKSNKFPLFSVNSYNLGVQKSDVMNFLRLNISDLTEALLDKIRNDKTLVLMLDSDNVHAVPAQRRFFFELAQKKINVPVVIIRKYKGLSAEKLQLYAATDVGGLLIDGYGEGVMLSAEYVDEREKDLVLETIKNDNNTAFGILQAARTRMSKTEYISCPSCGRTLFDLQETTAMIRKRTDHLKGVKIGIMGCIVNGPGEMADADFGYVGSGKGKITLYKGQEVVKKGVPSDKAVDELIEIIKENGRWNEPELVE